MVLCRSFRFDLSVLKLVRHQHILAEEPQASSAQEQSGSAHQLDLAPNLCGGLSAPAVIEHHDISRIGLAQPPKPSGFSMSETEQAYRPGLATSTRGAVGPASVTSLAWPPDPLLRA
jgi:hypothetical protein